MNRPFGSILLFGILFFFFSCKQATVQQEEETLSADAVSKTYRFGIWVDSLHCNQYQIATGDSPSLILRKLGFSPSEAGKIVDASRGVLDPTRLQAGRSYSTFSTRDSIPEICYLVFEKTPTQFAVIDLTGDSVRSYPFEKEVALHRKYVEGFIQSSLWNCLKAQEVDPLLAVYIADVFAWEIDFFDVKEGDSFRVLYDESYIDDTTRLRISSVQGAVFNHRGKDFFAIPFVQDSIFEYFDENGKSLRKEFLKAPLDFFRITSRFSNSRFHPVLKRYRAHHGVDYAAPVGTEVKSIGAGTVIAKGFQAGGGGNYVKIKHNSVYTTTYMHLSRFPKGLTTGKTVQQGEVIGYVGSTGLSTGPHLDFRVYKNGQPIDPLKLESPPSEPVKEELMDSFRLVKDKILMELEHHRK